MLMCNSERICSSLLADILRALRKYKTQMAPIRIESSCTEEGKKDRRSRGAKNARSTWLPESTKQSSQRRTRQPWSLHVSTPGLLHTFCGSLAWGWCWLLTREMEVFMALLPACGPFFLLLGCLVQPWYEGYAQPSCISLCQVWLISLGTEEQ